MTGLFMAFYLPLTENGVPSTHDSRMMPGETNPASKDPPVMGHRFTVVGQQYLKRSSEVSPLKNVIPFEITRDAPANNCIPVNW